MNNWKQPTPTDIRANENIDTLSRMLFFDILNGCQNDEYHKVYWHGNKCISLILQRGQYLLNINKYKNDLGISRRRIEKSLEIISKFYSKLRIETKPFGTIVTVKDYDQIVEMKNEVKTKQKRSENEVKSKNKSDKSDKSDKNNTGKSKKIYGNKNVTFVLEEFENIFGYECINRRGQTSRQQAWNFLQILKGQMKNKKAYEKTIKNVIPVYFKWVKKQQWGSEIVSLHPLKDNLYKFIAKVKNGEIKL